MTVVDEVLAHLELAYGARFLPPMRAFYAEGLRTVAPALLPDAVLRAMRKKPARAMPTVDDILAAAAAERQAQWQAAKLKSTTLHGAVRGAERQPMTAARRAYVRECFVLVEQLIGGVLTAADRLEAFRDLGARYPGLGWDEAARDVARDVAVQRGRPHASAT